MRILFVCSANICRSAVAEMLLKSELSRLGVAGVDVSSGGVLGFSGKNRDGVMCRLSAEYGYSLGGISRQVSLEEVNSSDLVIVMDALNYVEVQKLMRYDRWNRIHMFMEICFGVENASVQDPTYDSDERYRQVFCQILDGCKSLAVRLRDELQSGT